MLHATFKWGYYWLRRRKNPPQNILLPDLSNSKCPRARRSVGCYSPSEEQCVPWAQSTHLQAPHPSNQRRYLVWDEEHISKISRRDGLAARNPSLPFPSRFLPASSFHLPLYAFPSCFALMLSVLCPCLVPVPAAEN